ncbi:phage minor head protein [Riemerella anatipestifer]|nr:phage minor head protein [Riemerella anatipestifer]
MRAYLEQDAFIFSGLKTHTQLAEARSYLKDEKGNLRPYHDFEQKVLKLNKQYNQHYLEAEYEFAAHSAMSAANWANLQEDTGRYWLEYRTAGDERVRASHQQLNGICLPKTDAFWTEYYPPNGWRCRCVAVEVLAREKKPSDSQKAQELGQYATSQIGKSGKNKLAMFRFNPGQQKKMFPPNNSYNPKFCNNGKITLNLDNNNILLSLEDERCKAKQIIEEKAEQSTQAKLRKKYLEEMKPLLSKTVKKEVDGKAIRVKFTTKGNKHLYSDTFGRSTYPKEELKYIDRRLEKAEFVREAEISKQRKDNIRKFYYFKDKELNCYYNVAEEIYKGSVKAFLYAITKNIK